MAPVVHAAAAEWGAPEIVPAPKLKSRRSDGIRMAPVVRATAEELGAPENYTSNKIGIKEIGWNENRTGRLSCRCRTGYA